MLRALKSIQSQSSAVDEVIIVDDASTDTTESIAQRFPEYRYIKLAVNGGAAQARNVGIREAQHDLIAFLDSDDEWHLNKIELQKEQFNRYPGVDLVVTGVNVVKQGLHPALHPIPEMPEHGWTFDQLQTHPFSTPTWLARKSVLLDSGLFDESLPNREDLDLIARISSKYKILGIDMPLLTKHSQNDSIDADSKKLIASMEILMSRYPEMWAKSPITAAKNYRLLANLHFSNGNMKMGRIFLNKALHISDKKMIISFIWLLSFFGKGPYNFIRKYVRK